MQVMLLLGHPPNLKLFSMLIEMLVQMLTCMLGVSIVSMWFAKWYSKRCIKQSMVLVKEQLDEFQSIANTYTENGTPTELQVMIESLEGVMEELQFIQDNNLKPN